jgi:O-succinylbenzoate synthase
VKIAFSKYVLFPIKTGFRKPREGALLKVSFADGSCGYADCHPWEELGDLSLDDQLKILGKGKDTPLTKQSIRFAKIDAQARSEKQHLFHGAELPTNHYHISDYSLIDNDLLTHLSKSGIRLIKVKMGADLVNDSIFLKKFTPIFQGNNLKLRLDFNCKLSEQKFLEFLKQCSGCLDVIDFFEDPFTYHPLQWRKIKEDYKVKLACDKDSINALAYPDSCDYLVVKPAVQEISAFLNDKRPLVLTSYLDHPIGQLSALYTASMILKEKNAILSDCGFLSHYAYTPTMFTHAFSQEKSQLIPSFKGCGWGYDDLLKKLEWQILL